MISRRHRGTEKDANESGTLVVSIRYGEAKVRKGFSGLSHHPSPDGDAVTPNGHPPHWLSTWMDPQILMRVLDRLSAIKAKLPPT